MKFAYFKSVMNCLDLIVIVLAYVCMSFNIYRQVQVNNLLDSLLVKENRQYNDFSFLCYWQYQFNIVLSATIFLAWIKVCRRWFFHRFDDSSLLVDLQIHQFQQDDDTTE